MGVIETLIAMFDGFAFIAAGDSRLFRLSELRCWAGGGMLDAATGSTGGRYDPCVRPLYGAYRG